MYFCSGCGQAARSVFEFNRHPASRDCGAREAVGEAEPRPAEPTERDPATTKYPRLDPREVWK